MTVNTVVLDFDGLLVDSQSPMLDEVYARTGHRFTFREWKYFEFLHETVARLTNSPFQTVCAWLNHTDVVCRGLPTAGAQLAVSYLHSIGLNLVIATSRPEYQKEETLAQVATFFPVIPPANVHLMPFGVHSAVFKNSILIRYKAIAPLDDCVGLLMKVRALKNPYNPMLILPDKPWNRRFYYPNGEQMFRIGNWEKDYGGWDRLAYNLERFKSVPA